MVPFKSKVVLFAIGMDCSNSRWIAISPSTSLIQTALPGEGRERRACWKVISLVWRLTSSRHSEPIKTKQPSCHHRTPGLWGCPCTNGGQWSDTEGDTQHLPAHHSKGAGGCRAGGEPEKVFWNLACESWCPTNRCGECPLPCFHPAAVCMTCGQLNNLKNIWEDNGE